MISRGAVISRPVKTGETPPNEWDMAHVCPVHPVADGQVVDAHGNVLDQSSFGIQFRFPIQSCGLPVRQDPARLGRIGRSQLGSIGFGIPDLGSWSRTRRKRRDGTRLGEDCLAQSTPGDVPVRTRATSTAAGLGLVADRLEGLLGRLEVIALKLDPPLLHRAARPAGVLEAGAERVEVVRFRVKAGDHRD
jgi:hypothetical protein